MISYPVKPDALKFKTFAGFSVVHNYSGFNALLTLYTWRAIMTSICKILVRKNMIQFSHRLSEYRIHLFSNNLILLQTIGISIPQLVHVLIFPTFSSQNLFTKDEIQFNWFVGAHFCHFHLTKSAGGRHLPRFLALLSTYVSWQTEHEP